MPFAYAFATFLSLYFPEATEFFSLERLGFIAFAGSIVASFLALYKPVERHLIPLLVLKEFKGKRILSRGTEKSLHQAFLRKKSFPINLYGNAKEALFANPLDRTRGVLRNSVYTIVLIALFCIAILFFPPNYPLFQNVTFENRIIAGAILMFFLVLLLHSLIEEIRKTPSKIFVEIIYLLVAEGMIESGTNLNKIEVALNRNDWHSAYYWTMRTEREDKYGGLYLNDFMSTPIEVKIEKKRDAIRKKRKRTARR